MRYNIHWFGLLNRMSLEESTVPLKPIFEKSPLTTLAALPLRPGMARVTLEEVENLYTLTAECRERPALWEGAFRLACLLRAKPEQEPVHGWITAAMERQVPDGSLPYSVTDALAVIRAAWAVYEHDARRPLLEKLALWCGWLFEHWDETLACPQLRAHSADLMELLENLYRVTGKKALLSLCDRLRQQAMDWSGILHTFAVQRPMSRVTPWKDMEAGLEAEGGDEAGFYTRQYLSCHGESLADGARAAQVTGLFSGNGRELSAGKAGWEKISRYHGAVCGGVTADETLGGTSPAMAVDAASLGAWAEAFAACGAAEDAAWAWSAAETLLVNGMPAALHEGKLIPFQRVNSLSVNCGTKDCYHVHADGEQPWRALNRLCRGYAALLSGAVSLTEAGAQVNLYVPGRYALPLKDGACVMNVSGRESEYTLTLTMKQPVKAALSLRVPEWTEDACITVNDEGGQEGHAGKYLTIDRTWQSGDTIRVSFARKVAVSEGHHQSCVIRYGAQVMAFIPGDDWAMALCGEPVLKDGRVVAPLRRVPDWRKRGGIPADLPVLPATEGETVQAELVPYASAPCRIALFPRGKQA